MLAAIKQCSDIPIRSWLFLSPNFSFSRGYDPWVSKSHSLELIDSVHVTLTVCVYLYGTHFYKEIGKDKKIYSQMQI